MSVGSKQKRSRRPGGAHALAIGRSPNLKYAKFKIRQFFLSGNRFAKFNARQIFPLSGNLRLRSTAPMAVGVVNLSL